MLIPIAHEDAKVRDLPWVTFGLMALCLVGFLATVVFAGHRQEGTAESLAAAVDYFAERPYLRPDPALLPEQTLASLDLPAERHGARAAAEQAELDRLTDVWLATAAEDPLWRFGLVPSAPRPAGYLGHAFLHAGWLHLLGNMLFLYLSGPFVEERWGRWRYLAFYLVAAVVSGAAFAIHFPYLHRPLVGASGAVAAVMGAFLAHFWHTRIRFLFAPLFPLPPYWRFAMRAVVVVPFWFAINLVGAALGDEAAPGMGTGTAYDAHIAGFAFGLLVAMVVRVVGKTADGPPSADVAAFAEAQSLVSAGKLERAELLAVQVLRREPSHDGAALLLWSLARRRGESEEAAPLLEGVIRRALRAGNEKAALAHWRELCAASPRLGVEPALALSLLQLLARLEDWRELERMQRLTLERLPATTPLHAILRLLRWSAAHPPLPPAAVRLAERALRHPDLTAAERPELEALLPVEGVAPRVRSWS